ITERVRAAGALLESAQQAQELAECNRRLLAEVNHRVKNSLASLMSLFNIAAASETDVGAFASGMRSRLLAMSRVHDMLAGADWEDVEMSDLAKAVLGALKQTLAHPVELTISGAAMRVSAHRATSLGLVLQELFT